MSMNTLCFFDPASSIDIAIGFIPYMQCISDITISGYRYVVNNLYHSLWTLAPQVFQAGPFLDPTLGNTPVPRKATGNACGIPPSDSDFILDANDPKKSAKPVDS